MAGRRPSALSKTGSELSSISVQKPENLGDGSKRRSLPKMQAGRPSKGSRLSSKEVNRSRGPSSVASEAGGPLSSRLGVAAMPSVGAASSAMSNVGAASSTMSNAGSRRVSSNHVKSKGKLPDNHKPGSQGYAKVMMMAAAKITTQVGSLYKSVKKENAIEPREPDAAAAAKTGAGASGDFGEALSVLEEGDSSGSDNGSQTSDESKEEKEEEEEEEEQEDSGSDDFDYVAAASRVNGLLESLKAEKRTEIMEELNDWYSARVDSVEADRENICKIEAEHQDRESEMKDNMKNLLQSFEMKQMHEVQVLVKCSQTLGHGAAHKRRQRFSKANGEEPQAGGGLSATIQMKVASRRNLESGEKKRKKKRKKRGASKDPTKDQEGQEAGSGRRQKPKDGKNDTKVGDEDGSGSGSSETDDDEGEEGRASGEDEGKEKPEENTQGLLTTAALDAAFDVEAARKLLKDMHDAPQKVLNAQQELPPAEILSTLAVVQEGQKELEHRANVAKRNCDTLRTALDHLTAEQGTEPPVSGPIKELIENVRQQVMGEDKCEGPDPEELEEECQELENKLAQQKRDIEALRRQKERSERMSFVIQSMQEEEKDAGSSATDDDEEAVERKVTVKKSEQHDARLEQLNNMQISWGTMKNQLNNKEAQKGVQSSMANQVRAAVNAEPASTMGRMQSMPTTDNQSMGPEFTDGDATDPKVDQLQRQIEDKDVMIRRAKRLLLRMRTEYELIQYCGRKAEEGIDSIVEDWNPPVYKLEDDLPDDWDLFDEVEELQVNEETAQQAKDKAPGKLGEGGAKEDGTVSKQPSRRASRASNTGSARGSKEPSHLTPRPKSSVVEKLTLLDESTAKEEHADAEVISTKSTKDGKKKGNKSRREAVKNENLHMPVATGNFIPDTSALENAGDQEAMNPAAIEEAELAIKKQIQDLQFQVMADGQKVKAERARQRQIKKDIAVMKKKYKAMTKADKTAPDSLEALQQQVKFYDDSEIGLNAQIAEIQEELDGQQRLMEQIQNTQEQEEAQVSAGVPVTADAYSPAGLPRTLPPGMAESITAPGSAGGSAAIPGSGPSHMAKQTAEEAAAAAAAPGTAVAGSAGLSLPVVRRSVEMVASDLPGQPSSVGRGLPQDSASAAGPPGSSEAAGIAGPPGSSEAAAATGNAATAATSATAAAAAATSATSLPGENIDASGQAASTGGKGTSFASHAKAPTPGASPQAAAAPGGQTAGAVTRSDTCKTVEKSHTTNAAVAEFGELVKMQQHNEDLKTEIDDIVQKMQMLRKAMKRGKASNMTREELRRIAGIPDDSEEAKPPPEYFQLKKEVRNKQTEVRSLRKRWWADHRDLEGIVAKTHRSMDGAPVETASRPSAPSSQQQQHPGPPTQMLSMSHQPAGDSQQPQAPSWLMGLAGGNVDASRQAHSGENKHFGFPLGDPNVHERKGQGLRRASTMIPKDMASAHDGHSDGNRESVIISTAQVRGLSRAKTNSLLQADLHEESSSLAASAFGSPLMVNAVPVRGVPRTLTSGPQRRMAQVQMSLGRPLQQATEEHHATLDLKPSSSKIAIDRTHLTKSATTATGHIHNLTIDTAQLEAAASSSGSKLEVEPAQRQRLFSIVQEQDGSPMIRTRTAPTMARASTVGGLNLPGARAGNATVPAALQPKIAKLDF